MKAGERCWFAPHRDLAVLYSWVADEPMKLSVITQQDDGTWHAGMADVGELGDFSTRDLAVQAVNDLLAQRDTARESASTEPTELPVIEPQDDGTWNAAIDGVCALGNFATRDLALQAVEDFFDQRDAARERIWGEPRE